MQAKHLLDCYQSLTITPPFLGKMIAKLEMTLSKACKIQKSDQAQ